MKGSPVLVRLGLLLPVLGLYIYACQQPALFMDSGGHQHGDTAGPGRGTLTGLACLLFGWLPHKLTVSWYANPALLTAMVLFAIGRHSGASLLAILASALGLATPLLLPHESSHPLAYPLPGYYWWQSSLILMQAIAGVFGAKTRSARVGKVVLIGAAISIVSLQPAVFREREARTIFRIKGRIVLPPGEDPKQVRFELTIPDAHLDVYPPPLRFTRWDKDMKVAADGRFEVDSRLPTLGEPTVVETLVESPSLLPFKASHPLTRTGNVYHADLPDSVISPLDLKPLDGPATFEHPSMDYMIDVPQGWKLVPEGRGPNLSLNGSQQRGVRISLHPGANLESQALPGSYRASKSAPKEHPRGRAQTEFSFHYQSKDLQYVAGIQLTSSSSSLVLQAKATGPTPEEAEQRFQSIQAVLDTFR